MAKIIHISIGMLIAILSCIVLCSNAQEHVFTKQVTKIIAGQNRNIKIDAEKAHIKITSSPDENYYIKIDFISKHTDKTKAEYQLSFFKHIITAKSKEVYVRNYILIGSNDELTGSIVAEYILKIPKNKTLTINNSLGDIIVENLRGNFHITTQYGNISLNNVSGSLSINSHIGELLLKNCAFESTIETKYTNCYFYNSGGTFNILSNLGAINYNVNTKLKSLNINASGTEITLINKNCTEHNLNLSSLQGKLFIDDCNLLNKILIEIDSRKTDDDKKVLIYNNPAIKSHITIKNKFANISIQ